MYKRISAEEIPNIIVDLPGNNSSDTYTDDDLGESDADFDHLSLPEFPTEANEIESEAGTSEVESEREASDIGSLSQVEQPELMEIYKLVNKKLKK